VRLHFLFNPIFWITIYGVGYITTILLISLFGMERIKKRVPRIIVLIFILIVFVIPPIILPFTLLTPKIPIPTPVSLSIGIAILTIFFIMRIAGQKEIGVSLGLKGKSGLVTSGIYRRMRHPLYVSNMLLVMGLALLFKSIYAFLFSIIYSLFFLPIIYFEERDLLEKYGEEYQEYKRKVPRMLIPWIF